MLTSHQRIETLCEQLKLQAVLGCYAGLAETAAEKDTSYIEYLEEILRGGHGIRWPNWPVFRRSRRWRISISILPPVPPGSGCLIWPAWPSWKKGRMSSSSDQAGLARRIWSLPLAIWRRNAG